VQVKWTLPCYDLMHYDCKGIHISLLSTFRRSLWPHAKQLRSCPQLFVPVSIGVLVISIFCARAYAVQAKVCDLENKSAVYHTVG